MLSAKYSQETAAAAAAAGDAGAAGAGSQDAAASLGIISTNLNYMSKDVDSIKLQVASLEHSMGHFYRGCRGYKP